MIDAGLCYVADAKTAILLLLVFRSDGKMQEGYSVTPGNRASLGMIAHDHGDFGVEFAGLLAL